MKEIIMKAYVKEGKLYKVQFPNGSSSKFQSLKAAKKFLADSNVIFSSMFYEMNMILIEIYKHYRELWILNVLQKNADLKSKLTNLESNLLQAHTLAGTIDGNNKSFNALVEFCTGSLSMISKFREVNYVKGSDTLRRHKLAELAERCILNQKRLSEYAKK